jgi:hypothetical protein
MPQYRPPLSDEALGDLLRRAALDEAPPAAARMRVIALYDRTHRLAGRAATAVRRLVAAALPDLTASPFAPALGVRGAAATGRQWLFKAEECEIDLRATARGEGWSLAGQLFGAPNAERVLLDGAKRASAQLVPTCEFSFADLPPGRYSLTVLGGDLEVVIRQFDLGDQTDA